MNNLKMETKLVYKAQAEYIKTARKEIKKLGKSISSATKDATRRVELMGWLQSKAATESTEARYTHLLRMYLKGVPYSKVEQKVKEGNEVVVSHLVWIADGFGINFSEIQGISMWLYDGPEEMKNFLKIA